MTTLDLGFAKAQLKANAEALLEGKTQLNAEERIQFNSIMDAAKILDQVATATMSGVDMSNVTISSNGTLITKRRAQGQDEYAAGENIAVATAGAPRRGGRLAADMFGPIEQQDTGFKSLEHFAWSVQNGSSDVRMLAGASTGVPSDGGYLIPPQYAHTMLDVSLETEIVRPRARAEGVIGASKTISSFDASTHGSGLISGIKLQWVEEGGDMTYSVPKSRQIVLNPKKSYILVPGTNELLADAPDWGNGIGGLMRAALSFGLDTAFLATGTGSGQPISVLNATSTISVAKASGQAAATIVYENLTAMLARLHPACYSSSVWICHQSALPQMLQLSIPVGIAGQYVPVMTGTAGNYSVLGRPIIFTEKLPTLGTVGDIMLVDLSQYVVGLQKDGFRLDTSSHLLFKTDETVFRLVVRIDGQPVWAKSFQPLNNAPTLSWAVTLATRS